MSSTALATRDQPRPFLPQDLPRDALLTRCAVAHIVARARGGGMLPGDICEEYWPKDLPLRALVTRAATGAASSTQTGWAAELSSVGVGTFLQSLQGSAGSALIQAGAKFDLGRNSRLNLPSATAAPAAAWTGEAQPVPVTAGVLANVQLGPYRKMMAISVITREISEYSQPAAEEVIGQLVRDSARLSLDSTIFSSTAPTTTNPGGLVAGVTPLTASTDTGLTACIADLRQLADAIVSNGGGTSIEFFCSYGRGIAVRAFAPGTPVHTSAMIPDGTIFAVDTAAFASAADPTPALETSAEALLHMEDTNPVNIGTVGTPNVVAAPSRSLFQTDCIGLRMTLKMCWILRRAGTAQWINSGLKW